MNKSEKVNITKESNHKYASLQSHRAAPRRISHHRIRYYQHGDFLASGQAWCVSVITGVQCGRHGSPPQRRCVALHALLPTHVHAAERTSPPTDELRSRDRSWRRVGTESLALHDSSSAPTLPDVYRRRQRRRDCADRWQGASTARRPADKRRTEAPAAGQYVAVPTRLRSAAAAATTERLGWSAVQS